MSIHRHNVQKARENFLETPVRKQNVQAKEFYW